MKIGLTSNSSEYRLKALQTGNPVELRLVFAVECDDEIEFLMHRILKPHRLRGEWFARTLEVEEKIEWLRAGKFEQIRAHAEELGMDAHPYENTGEKDEDGVYTLELVTTFPISTAKAEQVLERWWRFKAHRKQYMRDKRAGRPTGNGEVRE